MLRVSHPRLHGVCVISCACVGVQRVGHSSFVCSRARAGLAPSRAWVTFGGAEIGHPVAGIASQHALVVCDARWVEQVAPERHAPATELANVDRGREPPTCGLLREGGGPAGFYQARRLAEACREMQNAAEQVSVPILAHPSGTAWAAGWRRPPACRLRESRVHTARRMPASQVAQARPVVGGSTGCSSRPLFAVPRLREQGRSAPPASPHTNRVTVAGARRGLINATSCSPRQKPGQTLGKNVLHWEGTGDAFESDASRRAGFFERQPGKRNNKLDAGWHSAARLS